MAGAARWLSRWHWHWRVLRRRLAAMVLPGGVEVRGHCRRCGQCCRRLSLWTGGDWLRTEQDVRRFLRERPEYDRLVPVGTEDDGRLVFTCSWLTPDNRCRDHDERLPLCRSYPGPELWLAGVDLPEGCGFTLHGPGLDSLWRIPARRARRRSPDADDMDKMSGPDNGGEA